jgi:hypothetical protein
MARKPERYEPPKVGDYIARSEPLYGCGDFSAAHSPGYVALKTDTLSEKRISACATLEGARKLAKLLNDVRDIAHDWRCISAEPLNKGGSAEEWARIKIASSVCKVLGINAAHDFGASAMGLTVFGPSEPKSE